MIEIYGKQIVIAHEEMCGSGKGLRGTGWDSECNSIEVFVPRPPGPEPGPENLWQLDTFLEMLDTFRIPSSTGTLVR